MERYLLPHARNTVTGQTIKIQDLTGARFTLSQRPMCQKVSDQMAEKMTARTGDVWVGVVKEYSLRLRKI
jgi:ribosomal protein L14